MRWDICGQIPANSPDYFEKTLITPNGFREYDVRWILGKEINPNGFVVLGRAYGTYIQKVLNEKRIVVGHDFRKYSQEVCRSLILGLLSTGVHVIDIGLTLTPMAYFAQRRFGTKAAAMVTASHNENGWTGIKLADGLSSTLQPEGILRFKNFVFQTAEKYRHIQGNGSYESFDNISDCYLKDLVELCQVKSPAGIRVVLATGNGTAGHFVPGVLRALGCEVVELNCNLDWDFPNYNPNPEDTKFLKAISQKTVDSKANLGIGIDGDGDRIGIVDGKGREIFSDKMGLLLARWFAPKFPNRNIVIDVKSTSLYFSDPILKANNVNTVLWITGHSYIKAKVREIDAIAGFEKSGHWFLSSPLGYGYDDAALASAMVIKMLSEQKCALSDLVDSLGQTWQSPTLGPYCADSEKYQVVAQMQRAYEEARTCGAKIAGLKIRENITVNGIRFVLEDGSWGLIRASSNKPSLVLVAESLTSENHLYEIMADIQKRIEATGKIGEYDQKMAKH